MEKPDNKTPETHVPSVSHNTKILASKLKSRRRLLLILVLLVIVAGLGFAGWHYYKNNPNNPIARKLKTPSCSDTDLLHQAADAIKSNNSGNLKIVLDKMQKISKHDQDPNCLYVATMYYATTGDSQNGTAYLDKLKKAYDPKQGFNKALGNTASLNSLQITVNAVPSQQNYSQRDVFGGAKR